MKFMVFLSPFDSYKTHSVHPTVTDLEWKTSILLRVSFIRSSNFKLFFQKQVKNLNYWYENIFTVHGGPFQL